MFCFAIGRFVKRLFVVLVCDPAEGLCFENKRLVVFVCVALRAASILKHCVFWYLISVLQVTEYLYLGGFEHRECLRRLSFEK